MSSVDTSSGRMTEAPRVDVVLVNYRGWEAVVQAVDHLRRSGGSAGVGWPHGLVHVVDNSEDEEEARALREALAHWPEVRLHVLARNVGFGAGCNAAWAASDAPFVLLLNPDAQITAEAALQLAQVLRAQPELAAVSPRTWWDGPGGWVLPCPTPQEPFARWRRAVASRRDTAGWADEQVATTRRLMAATDTVEVEMLAGAVLMLRRSAVESLGCSFGLFDSAFFMYFEDADLSARLRKAGWKLAVVPTVDAVHAWRHQPHKAPLMAGGEAVFLERQPVSYRMLRRVWPGMEAMGRLPAPSFVLSDAMQAARLLGDVDALSPAPSGDPAWVRWSVAARLTAEEWALLEPGCYWARTPKGWRGFEKTGAPRADACPCCGFDLSRGLASWHFRCCGCGYEQARLQTQIRDGEAGTTPDQGPALDESLRREALEAIRRVNFGRLLKKMANHREPGQGDLLDVGAAHGWFVQACMQSDPPWRALGLEPDVEIAAQAQREGLNVRSGYFPQDLGPQECFDAITFHDVFEHLEDANAALAAVRRHLRADGLLVLNLPSSEGVFYRLARVMAKFGLRGPWDRMWQVGMPSPHLHYFNAANLQALLQRHGFEVLETTNLPSVVREGLMARLRFDPRSAWMAVVLGPLLWLLVPLIQRLSPDILVVVARCDQRSASARP